MRYICHECGKELEEGAEFCYHCGRSKKDALALDDNGTFVNESHTCPNCGQKISDGDAFCQKCGSQVSCSKCVPVLFKPKLRKYGWIGILLAVIPGYFYLFGLGHIWFKSYKRGLIYLLFSIPLILVTRGYLNGTFNSTLFMFLGIAMYLFQAMEVFGLAFMPEPPKKEKKD